MAKRRQSTRKHSLRRGKKHALSANVVSSRIVFLTLLRKAKHFLIYTLVTCLLVLFCWGIFYSARKLVMEGDRFQLEAIQITPTPHKNSFFTYQNLPEITGINISDSIFAHNLGQIEKRLSAYPELVKATLTREFPGTIKIDLEERLPIAKIIHKGESFLIDQSGYCFQSRFISGDLLNSLPILQTRHTHELPFDLETKSLQNIGVQRALSLASDWPHHVLYQEKLISVKVNDLHSLIAITESGSQITFGYYEHERQLQDFNSILSHAHSEHKLIKEANLLPFENIPVIFDNSKTPPKPKPVITPKKKEMDSDLMKILNRG